ncbi:hypothetical protein WME79_42920 [Sorangium sp. So ce726]|uniref:hypothetical protein n=1 Tax=Sorangium sp. So ce726 TaxID=3133319 RepID=UPI003F62F17A
MSPRTSIRSTLLVLAAAALSACQTNAASPVLSTSAALSRGCPDAEPPPDCQLITDGGVAAPISPGGPQGTPPDAVIKDCRVVPRGTFTYGNINVIKGGALFFRDEPGETRLYARSILVQKGGSLRAGAWCKPFGSGGGKLTIGLWGGAPGVDKTPGATCKDESGKEAACYPPDRVGKLCTGPDLNDPCQASDTRETAGNSARFEGYENLHGDGTYFGSKVFAVSYGGSVALFGKKGVADSVRANPEAPAARERMCAIPPADQQLDDAAWAAGSGISWARLNQGAAPSSTALVVDRPVDWAQGDKIVLATTDWQPSHSELLTLAGASGQELTLPPGGATREFHEGKLFQIDPKRLSHDPARTRKTVDVRAAVGLLTRSITIRSMGATFDPTSGMPKDFPRAEDCRLDPSKPPPPEDCYFGGHVIARQGFGRFQLQGVELYQLGQGGRMGHYPVHFHLAKDTSYTNAFVADSSIWESNTRFVTIHGTHGVNVARNVGFLSVGHAFYLEDGSEIDNSFCYNLGVSARATFKEYFTAQDRDSPTQRFVPPILDKVLNADTQQPDTVGSDSMTPAMFWIMNADNDFVGNKAVGVEGVGTCYWPLHSFISGPSRTMSWSPGYASWNGPGQVAPLRRFRGNSCSTAAYAIMMERASGFPLPENLSSNAGLTPVPAPHDVGSDMLPRLSANFNATRATSSGEPMGTCSPGMKGNLAGVPGGGAEACATTVIDHFTTSFNWAEDNVGSVWLRPYHYLFSNSAVTDQLYGGLGMVSGGSPEQALPGQLAIAADSVFVSSTADPLAPAASSLGPILWTDASKTCTGAFDNERARCTGAFCTLKKDGVSYFVGGFQPKRLITIYDGPFFSDGNVFIADERAGSPPCWSVYSRTNQPLVDKSRVRVVDAGVGWKQPNGFYYPPVFAFRDSGFGLASTRHNVVDQYQDYYYGNGDPVPPKPEVHRILGDQSFTPIDTTTILNDLDGTLNGIKPKEGVARSSGLSNNHFYDAPMTVPECNSFGTVTMPHEFASTFIARLTAMPSSPVITNDSPTTDDSWSGRKPAVAVYRQYRLDSKDPAERCEGAATICSDAATQACLRGTFFMGAALGQGMGLTMRNGKFFIDTASAAQNGACLGASNVGYQRASFDKNNTYAVYNLFANSETRVTYQIYVGPSFDPKKHFNWVRVLPHGNASTRYLTKKEASLPPPDAAAFDRKTGVLTITIDHSRIAGSFDFDPKDDLRCQPRDLCSPSPDNKGCVAAGSLPRGYEGLEKLVARVCETWAARAYSEVKDVGSPDKGLFLAECPAGGCLGFAFTLPADFQPKPYNAVDPKLKLTEVYPKNEIWNRPMVAADAQSCPLPAGSGGGGAP